MVTRLPNSIGYVEYAYVKQNKMVAAVLQNSAGNWVMPSEDSFRAAAITADWTRSYYQILTNQQDKNAWPITGATYILVYRNTEEGTKAALKFFDWTYSNGDKAADDLDYVALPLVVKEKIRQDWKKF